MIGKREETLQFLIDTSCESKRVEFVAELDERGDFLGIGLWTLANSLERRARHIVATTHARAHPLFGHQFH